MVTQSRNNRQRALVSFFVPQQSVDHERESVMDGAFGGRQTYLPGPAIT
jgi:hypothetical protein